jgi:two-component system phosphate regulon sensor histidine kinase PhoR
MTSDALSSAEEAAAGPDSGAEAVPPLDPVALLDGMTGLVELVNSGETGLPAIQLTVEFAAAATGASGATFVEYTGDNGRIVAATESLSWSLGRPVDPTDPRLAKLLAGPPAAAAGLDLLSPDGEDQLRARGFRRMLMSVTSADGAVVGSLHAYFTDGDGVADPHQLAVLRLLAAAAAHVYRDGPGLPVYPSEPPPHHPAAHDRMEARDLFVAVTSHELRTPVTVIKGYADTLAERWDSLADKARREAVFVIWQRARELARLVDRLLNASNDVAWRRDSPTLLPFEPVTALRDAVDELAADLRHSLRVSLPGRLPAVRGDRASLATVLTELVTNARKYSPDRVEIELTAGSDERTVWVRVTDRGLGIPPEYAERAFERFWQLETGDQRRYGGVGLGLYLVRRIVERQNGWVSLRPRDGGGTVAEVRLPRADVAARGIG